MSILIRIDRLFAGAGMAVMLVATNARAAAPEVELPTPASHYTQNSHTYLLVLNEGDAGKERAAVQVSPAAEFEPPLFSGSNAHKYLGLGTLALAFATAIAPKPAEVDERVATQAEIDEQNSSTHARLGQATAVMAAATVTTGLLAHWDDFHLEDGWSDPDNLHVMLGTVGALAMLYAVSQAPATEHAGLGVTGGVAMAAAIKITW